VVVALSAKSLVMVALLAKKFVVDELIKNELVAKRFVAEAFVAISSSIRARVIVVVASVLVPETTSVPGINTLPRYVDVPIVIVST
jgi:hypothetical protein